MVHQTLSNQQRGKHPLLKFLSPTYLLQDPVRLAGFSPAHTEHPAGVAQNELDAQLIDCRKFEGKLRHLGIGGSCGPWSSVRRICYAHKHLWMLMCSMLLRLIVGDSCSFLALCSLCTVVSQSSAQEPHLPFPFCWPSCPSPSKSYNRH